VAFLSFSGFVGNSGFFANLLAERLRIEDVIALFLLSEVFGPILIV